jgi:hypothetical protein
LEESKLEDEDEMIILTAPLEYLSTLRHRN